MRSSRPEFLSKYSRTGGRPGREAFSVSHSTPAIVSGRPRRNCGKISFKRSARENSASSPAASASEADISCAGRPVSRIQPAVPSKAVKLWPFEIEMRLLGDLVNNSIGLSLPPARIVPFMTRLVTFLIASAPPMAVTYFSTIWSAVVAAAPGVAGAAGRAGASPSSTGGVFTGRADPRWQEKHVTCNWPRKLSLLMAACMAIISRAVFFAPLSSASILPATWQKVHSTPREDAMNVIAGPNWSAGIPLSWTRFLYTSSALLDAAAACARTGCAVNPADTRVTATAKVVWKSLIVNAPRLFGLYPILEWLSSALAFALAALLHRECLFRLVSLLSHRIGDCYRNLILPRRGLRQQRNPHGSHHVALGIETLALLHRRLGLGPQHLPAGPEHAGDVAHVDAILVTIFEPDDVELSP